MFNTGSKSTWKRIDLDVGDQLDPHAAAAKQEDGAMTRIKFPSYPKLQSEQEQKKILIDVADVRCGIAGAGGKS